MSSYHIVTEDCSFDFLQHKGECLDDKETVSGEFERNGKNDERPGREIGGE